MKIIDLRCGRVLEGEFVEKISGGSSLSDEQLECYLGIQPGDKEYQYHRRPSVHKTIVLKRENDEGFYVVPINEKFYRVEP